VDAIGRHELTDLAKSFDLSLKPGVKLRWRVDKKIAPNANDRHPRRKGHLEEWKPEPDQGTIHDPDLVCHALKRVQWLVEGSARHRMPKCLVGSHTVETSGRLPT
jgi:hypothetical protein